MTNKLLGYAIAGVISLSGCTIYEDQVRIPRTIPKKYQLEDGTRVKTYDNQFGVDTIIELRGTNINENYIACCGNLENLRLNFYENNKNNKRYSRRGMSKENWKNIEEKFEEIKKEIIIKRAINKQLELEKRLEKVKKQSLK